MLHRIFGLETEYGLLIHEDRPDHSPTWFAHQIRNHLFQVQRRGVLDLHHRGHDEPPGNGGFITNGGRIYLDMGHLEYASPECHSLTDVVASDRAGDLLLQRAIEDLGLSEHVSLIKNNIDHETDATFGSHENYLVSRRFPFSRRGLAPFVTFLVTRQIFTGAGRIGAASPQDAWIQVDRLIVPRATVGVRGGSNLPFQISQRSDYIVNDFFEWVQHNRAIVNTRDEPLADPNEFRRIHLLLGDSNMAEYATALKLGVTGLVLQLIEEGHALRIWRLMNRWRRYKKSPRTNSGTGSFDFSLNEPYRLLIFKNSFLIVRCGIVGDRMRKLIGSLRNGRRSSTICAGIIRSWLAVWIGPQSCGCWNVSEKPNEWTGAILCSRVWIWSITT